MTGLNDVLRDIVGSFFFFDLELRQMVRYKMSLLEEKHMMSTLLYLYRNGEAAKCVIYDNVSKNPRMPLKLDMLKRAGLVQMSYGMPTYVSLTEKGRYIASRIEDIENNI